MKIDLYFWYHKHTYSAHRDRDRCRLALYNLLKSFIEKNSSKAQIAGKIEPWKIKEIYKCQETKLQNNVGSDSKARADKMPSGVEIRGSRSHLSRVSQMSFC